MQIIQPHWPCHCSNCSGLWADGYVRRRCSLWTCLWADSTVAILKLSSIILPKFRNWTHRAAEFGIVTLLGRGKSKGSGEYWTYPRSPSSNAKFLETNMFGVGRPVCTNQPKWNRFFAGLWRWRWSMTNWFWFILPIYRTRHGTKTVLEVLAGMDVNPERIWIDHVEQTIAIEKLTLDIGRAWRFTRLRSAVRVGRLIFREYPRERLLVNSSADQSEWSIHLEPIVEFRRRGHSLRCGGNLPA